MGDFYETFEEDALKASSILGITLSKRANGRANTVPLAGFPYHALDTHLPKLVQAGMRVAICEQLENPKTTRQLVKRGVVEVVSPGVSMHDNLLNPKQANYLAALHWAQQRGKTDLVGLSYMDISTGEFVVTETLQSGLDNLLHAIAPSEILVDRNHKERLEASRYRTFVTTPQEDWVFTSEYSHDLLLRHFSTHSLKGFGVASLDYGLIAAGAILHYLQETQQGGLSHIKRIVRRTDNKYVVLDPQTKANLSLISSVQEERKDGPLIKIMDRSRTPMGARLLRRWLEAPLRNVEAIRQRLDGVETFYNDGQPRGHVRTLLRSICDIERIVARLCTGRAKPRDLAALRGALEEIPNIKHVLHDTECKILKNIYEEIDTCSDIYALIQRALVDTPPASDRGGGIFRNGYSETLDELRSMARSGKDFVARMQKAESERTGIPSLKVGYNKVFGYYLEITNAHRDKVPDNYIRKQTLVNAERYITPELKKYEEQILTAEEKLIELERDLFMDLQVQLSQDATRLQSVAAVLATLDCYVTFAEVASDFGYHLPHVDDSFGLYIAYGRHPVVERSVAPVIPNSVRLDTIKEQIYIITGPNMAGKSVVLRQTGVIVLLAQAGSFVPARKADIGIVDTIFTRVGASDNLVAGESTFLVEMNETANILHNATPRSLILLDEVGRGTSTFDGLSIAWALIEHLHEDARVAARTLFATHYHELNELVDRFDRIRNYRIQVREHEGRVVFLRKLEPGSADHSYGLEVARMAGLPESILERAKQILTQLEHQPVAEAASAESQKESEASMQMSLFGMEMTSPVEERVRALDVNQMTPLEALIELAELKKLAE